MRTVTLSTASVTWAMKARDALLSFGIASRLVRLRPEESPNGCAWGLELAENDLRRASNILSRGGIPFRTAKL